MSRFPWMGEDWPLPSAQLDQLADKIDFAPWLNHGNLTKWLATLEGMPAHQTNSVELSRWVGPRGQTSDLEQLTQSLMALKPWRKGPYQLFDIQIDTEWRSDLKWERIKSAISPGTQRVLDVGCGSGYHLWRLLEAGCSEVLGVDPSLLFAIQFAAIQKHCRQPGIHFWPIPLEAMPESQLFDLVLSMGVLYHRRSPIDHLTQLRDQMTPGGQLILETLVIEGDEHQVLVPPDRYARMRNCWFIPSVAALERWMSRAGFENIQCLDQTPTTEDEQRKTPWIDGQSLEMSLDPDDPSKTIEGLPAPLRATLVAKRPG